MPALQSGLWGWTASSPCTAPWAAGSLTPPAGLSPPWGKAAFHWLSRIQLLSLTHSQPQLSVEPRGAEAGVALCINPAGASAAQLSAGLKQGRCLSPKPQQRRAGVSHIRPTAGGLVPQGVRLQLHLFTLQHQAGGRYNPRGLSKPLCLLWVPQALGISHTAAICLQGKSFNDERFYKIHWQRATVFIWGG